MWGVMGMGEGSRAKRFCLHLMAVSEIVCFTAFIWVMFMAYVLHQEESEVISGIFVLLGFMLIRFAVGTTLMGVFMREEVLNIFEKRTREMK